MIQLSSMIVQELSCTGDMAVSPGRHTCQSQTYISQACASSQLVVTMSIMAAAASVLVLCMLLPPEACMAARKYSAFVPDTGL